MRGGPSPYQAEVPAASALANCGFDDFRHACTIDVPADVDLDAEQWAQLMFTDPPRVIRLLLRGRDAAARLFGLQPVVAVKDVASGLGMRIGPFPILDRGPTEVVFGLEDTHLDFRSSVIVEKTGQQQRISCCTVVRIHSALGRAYFVPVRVVHPLLTATLLRRAGHAAAV